MLQKIFQIRGLSIIIIIAFLFITLVNFSYQPVKAFDHPLLWLETVDNSMAPETVHTGLRPISQFSRSAVSQHRDSTAIQPSTHQAIKTVETTTVSAAFLLEIYPDEKMYYIPNIDSPGEWVSIESIPGTSYYAGDFVGKDYNQLYVIDYTKNELHTLNTFSGADATIGACNPLAGHVWTGATGTAEGVLYASSTDGTVSHLYTVNIATGAATPIGQITNSMVIIDIAINIDGDMYGIEIENDVLVEINPTTGAGTVVGAIGYDADYAQGMDFDEGTGTLYLAAYNVTAARGELRMANTSTGNSTLVGSFPDDAQTDVLAFTPPATQPLQNPGFENGLAGWSTESFPSLSENSHGGSWSAKLSGEECWVWQNIFIPPGTTNISFGYWITGISSDTDWDNDILLGGIWDQTRQTQYVDVRFGLTYFYSYPMEWKRKIYTLDANEMASVSGKNVVVGFQLTQDWNPGYHRTSTAYIDDVTLYITGPVYDYALHLPIVIK